MRTLGIETSCDETGVAIYDSTQGLMAHTLYSQVAEHQAYGGVVPELASRDHIRKTIPLIDSVLKKANLLPTDIDGIAYTAGPGLAGALLVGAMIGQSLAYAWNIPAIAIHHMEGHLLASMLEANPPQLPFVALLVSGGHTQLIKVAAAHDYTILGDTLDDAVGEAFDKTAKLLGLAYPGGKALAELADIGNPTRFHFPRPMTDRPGLEFSFSGLKTHAANIILRETMDHQTRADIARAFQDAATETLLIKCQRAMRLTGYKTLVVAGGVGANTALRSLLARELSKEGVSTYFPRLEFCTDNGAMIAYAGHLRLLNKQQQPDFAASVYPRWQLSELKRSP